MAWPYLFGIYAILLSIPSAPMTPKIALRNPFFLHRKLFCPCFAKLFLITNIVRKKMRAVMIKLLFGMNTIYYNYTDGIIL